MALPPTRTAGAVASAHRHAGWSAADAVALADVRQAARSAFVAAVTPLVIELQRARLLSPAAARDADAWVRPSRPVRPT